jgi:Contractile injection system tube protein
VPEPATIAKAELRVIRLPDRDQQARETGEPRLTVDFNPATLKVVYSNSFASKDQRGGSARQFVSKSSTRLSVELWFDVTTTPGRNDVRDRTELVKRFLVAAKVREGREEKLVPPGVLFVWGSFAFQGVMETMDESLELFSPDGRPLRAKVTVAISSQEIQDRIDPSTLPGPGGPAPGTTPRQQVRQDESVQQLVGRSGNPDQWQEVAEANQIEQPRRPPTGLLVDVHARG